MGGKKTLLFSGFRHALYHPRERARPLSGTSTPAKASLKRFPIFAPVARGGASLFGGGSGSAAAPISDPEVEVAPSGFLPPPDIPLYARTPPSREAHVKKDAVLSEVAQAEAEKMMVRIEREAATPAAPGGVGVGGGGMGVGGGTFDEESARQVQNALSDAQAAARRRSRALEAAAEASTESDAAHEAAKRAQAAAREMGSGAGSLPDRERARLERVKVELEEGREKAEDCIMALKTAEDAKVAAEAQRADALAVAR